MPDSEDSRLKIATNATDIKNLREVVDLKLDKLTSDVSDLRNILKWAGGLIVSLMLSFMAWALLQQYNANEAAKSDLQNQVNILRQQRESRVERQQILDELRTNTRGDEANARGDAASDARAAESATPPRSR